MAKQLTKQGLQAIREDADLYAAVAKELDVRPLYMPKLIRDKSIRLTELGVLILIADKLGLEPTALIEEVDADMVA